MMKIDTDAFRVREGEPVDLRERGARGAPICDSKGHYKHLLAQHVSELSAQQELLYASNRFAVLLIFQAMDAAGKDGVIKHVMSGVNPQGCQVFSFKHPSTAELEHDFLWRTTRELPARGKIGIFNRSYYEEVLIARVHPEILRGEGLIGGAADQEAVWVNRYRSIADLERHLHANGTQIIKFFLHLSKAEQRRRFLERLDQPDKSWKLGFADIKERKFWKDYRQAYEKCLAATSTTNSPWYVVPADDKESARLIVSRIILDTLNGLALALPVTSQARDAELLAMRAQLTKGKAAKRSAHHFKENPESAGKH